MTKKLPLLLMLGALTAFAFPLVQADGVGLSGQCYNADASQGGEDEVRVDSGGTIKVLPNLLSGHGVIEALTLFATETVKDGGQTGNACKRYDCFSNCPVGQSERYDYLEADATVGGNTVQACYRTNPNGQGASVVITGECPSSPTGQGT